MMHASQKYALVSGGNRGIGRAVCQKLVQKGKPLLLGARDKAAGQQAAQELSQGAASPVKFLQLDIAHDASVNSLVSTLAKDYNQQVDLLVHNAGIALDGWTAAAFEDNMRVNLFAPVDLTYKLLPYLSPGALIVIVGSTGGKLRMLSEDYRERVTSSNSLAELRAAAVFDPDSPMPGHFSWCPSYCVSKGYLNRAVQLMSGSPELKDRGVRLAVVCPGWTKTRIGTEKAPRTPEQAADAVLWPWEHWEPSLEGSFTTDGKPNDW